MKRLLSWMLVLCMALSLVPAGLAEEFFAEESFIGAPTGDDENLFFEEGFFGDDSFFAVDGEEAAAAEDEDEPDFAGLETRSIVSFATDQVEEILGPDGDEMRPTDDISSDADILYWTENGYWKVKPLLNAFSDETDVKKSDTITLSWLQPINPLTLGLDGYDGMGVVATKTKVDKSTGVTTILEKGAPKAMPKGITYYVYAVNEDTGVAYELPEMGKKGIAPKPVKQFIWTDDDGIEEQERVLGDGKSVIGFGGTLVLKKRDGNFTYFVRAERNVEQKATKLKVETYGISSDKVYPRAASLDWSKKVTKITAVQQGDAIAVSWEDKYNGLDGFVFQALKDKDVPVGPTFVLEIPDHDFIDPDDVDPDDDLEIDEVTVNGTTYSYSWPLPVDDDGNPDYLPTDQFYFAIIPIKVDANGVPMNGAQIAKSGKVKLAEPWKTLAKFKISETNSKNPIDHSEVWMEWTVPVTDVQKAPITYTLGGLSGKATIEVSWVDGEPKVVETTPKNPLFVGDNGEVMVDSDGEEIVVTVIAPVKVAATAKVDVTPAQDKKKGNKTVGTVTFKESFMAKPTITSGAQIAENKVQLTFAQCRMPQEGEIFEIVGFNGQTMMQTEISDTGIVFKNVAPAAKMSDAIMTYDYDDEDRIVYIVEGTIAPVKANKALKFTVQPKLAGLVGGKAKTVAGTKSDAYSVDVMPTLTAAAMNIQIGGIESVGDEHTLSVTFMELPSATLDTAKGIAIKSISASLVATDSFDGGYSQRWTITRAKTESGVWTEGWDPHSDTDMIEPYDGSETANFEATFTKSGGMDIRPEAKYTVFIETYLLVWDKSANNKKGDWVDGGRSIDKASSIAGGEKMKDPSLLVKPYLSLIKNQITDKLNEGGFYWSDEETRILVADGRMITLDLSKLKPGDDYGTYPEGTKFGYSINGKAVSGVEGETHLQLDEGDNAIIFWAEINGVKGVKSDPIALKAYEPITIEGFGGPDTAMNNVTLNANGFGGGSGDLTAIVYVGNDVENAKPWPEANEIKLDLPANAQVGDEIDFYFRVTDGNILQAKGAQMIPYAVSEKHTVQKSADAEVDAFTYRLASSDARAAANADADAKLVQVVDYNPAKYVPAGETDSATKPIVPLTVEIEGNEYTVIEIGGTGTETAPVGAFEGDEIEAITLPNAVVIIGANAFKDCASLATMTCYPDAQ